MGSRLANGALRRALSAAVPMFHSAAWRTLIYRRNMRKYKNPPGPTYDWFKKQGRSDADIIKSSASPSGADLGLAGLTR